MIRRDMNVNYGILDSYLNYDGHIAGHVEHWVEISLDSYIHIAENALYALPKDHRLVPNFVILPRSKNTLLDHVFLLGRRGFYVTE